MQLLRLALWVFFCSLFSFSQAQTVTIIQPNGGEILYACQEYPVQWSQTGTPSDFWDIDFSLDGGTIWTSVASNFLSTTGEFLWTVPNVQSTTVLMRVRDALDTLTVDESDAFFTINIPIQLVVPNGGEVWTGNTTETITWDVAGTSNRYNLYYSTNAGASWQVIAIDYSSPIGSYDWDIPTFITSTNCLIRIEDYVTSCMVDESDAVFTINAPDPVLVSPHGGSLEAGCGFSIWWASSTFYTTVDIEFSLDNGATWTLLTAGQPNDGTYPWTVPNTPSDSCLIKVYNSGAPSNYDQSDNVFSISPAITLISPSPTDTLYGCNTYEIEWEASSCMERFNLSYSLDDGATWTSLATYHFSGSTPRSYSWEVPNEITSSEVLISVQYYFNSGFSGVTDTAFTLLPNEGINVTSPNGGETLTASAVQTLTWDNLPEASGTYHIYYSTDGGSSYTVVAINHTGNSYDWTVPNENSSNCLLLVVDALHSSCRRDISDATWTIEPDTVELASPHGGTLEAGCGYTIWWNSSTFYTTVDIEFSQDNGATWTLLTAGQPNDGTYPWTVPNTPSDSCLIKVYNSGAPSNYDQSDNVFSISPAITLISPSPTDTLYGCNTYEIEWEASSCMERFNLSYSLDDGATWTSLATYHFSGSTPRSYSWEVPNEITSSEVLISVQYYFNSGFSGVTDTSFTLLPNEGINVTSPNGGETLTASAVQTLTWDNLPEASGTYHIYYSTDGGSSYTVIAINHTGNSYDWTVPNENSSNCLLLVVDALHSSCRRDISDAAWTIEPDTVELASPHGGTLEAGCGYTIWWNSSTFYTTVDIEFSQDNGATWTLLTAGQPNDGSYPWTVPNTPSDSCLIKVYNSGAPSNFDQSDNVFSISPAITLISPSPTDTLYGCNTYEIEWEASSCMERFNLSYSLDDGATWTSLATYHFSGSTPRSYSWEVPNEITSSEVLVSVQYYFNSGFSGVTDTAFTLLPNEGINVTSPNGGETLTASAVQTLTWDNLPEASGTYHIYYSTDGGSSYTVIAINHTGNSFDWTVPNENSSNCLLLVVDALHSSCRRDISDAAWTIEPDTVELASPHGGTLEAGCGYTIWWNSSTFYTTVDIEFSQDNGATWTLLTAGQPNDGTYPWTVPNTPSDSCLIKVYNSGAPSNYDQSDNVFSISPAITLISPSPTDTLYGCNTYEIEWEASSCMERFNLSYSLDDGATWTSLATYHFSGATPRSYSWEVPNEITSSEVLVSVQYYFNSGFSGVTDTAFTLLPNKGINVTSPNGGETLTASAVQTLTWDNLPEASGTYHIYYSTDGGSSYTVIAINHTGNSYDWTVPNENSSNCLLLVVDALHSSCRRDISDAAWTIEPDTVELASPHGGTLEAGCGYTIWWNSSTFYTTVDIEFSQDNGATWTLLTAGQPNDGSYPWTVPNTPSDSCLIKVYNSGAPSNFDQSDNVFSITPAITLISPSPTDTLYGCNTYEIEWEASSCMERFNLSYSLDDGVTWTSLATYHFSGATPRSYSWEVPNEITSSEVLVSVQYYFNSGFSGVTDTAFTLLPNEGINVTSPNGGETLTASAIQTLTWDNLPEASGTYHIYYSTDGGSSYTVIAINHTGNSFDWTVPNENSSNCLLLVVDALHSSCRRDISDATWTILPETPILVSPNGGESFYAGTTHNIWWASSSLYTTAGLEYSLDNGATWTIITPGTPNDGFYNWVLPNTDSDSCLVKVYNSDDPANFDTSDSVFSIKPAVTVLTPNGDNGITLWRGCTVTSITFDRSPAWNRYNILYSTNNGVTWNTIASNWLSNDNPASYDWDIPNEPGTNNLVKVEPTPIPSYGDTSDSTFSITKPVTILQPNFGGILTTGTTYDIKWKSDGISNIYDLFYSIDGGSSFTNIITGFSTSINTYTWTVPPGASSNCLIWVRDNINHCKDDTSDMFFVISPSLAPITLTYPNGEDTLGGCSLQSITWTESPVIGMYDLAYSTNSGSTWTDIVLGYATTSGSYDWAVPNGIDSDEVLIRIRSALTPTTFDLSDALLSIHSNEIVATPTLSSICASESIMLTAIGGDNYLWSPALGLDDDTLANPLATPLLPTTYVVSSDFGACVLTDTIFIDVSGGTDTANVEISVTPDDSICVGEGVTFSATPTFGGTDPVYQWKVNGFAVGTDSDTYSTSSLTDGDAVSVEMSSSHTCVIGSPVTSNAITMRVSPLLTPEISITASDTIQCSGSPVTFSALPVNEGAFPVYQWKLNGLDVGTGGPSYTNSTLVDGDMVALHLTSSEGCVTVPTSMSSPITISILSGIPASPDSIFGDTILCAAGSSIYSISPVADADSYFWMLPPGWSGSSSSPSITVTPDLGTGILTVTANNACGTSLASSLSINVSSIPTVTLGALSSVCIGSSPFLLSGGSPAGGIFSGVGVVDDTTFSAAISGVGTHLITYTYVDSLGCSNSDTASLLVDLCTALEVSHSAGDFIIYPNPFSQSLNIKGKGLNRVKIFDALGQLVLESKGSTRDFLSIDTSKLSSGMYSLDIYSLNGIESIKIIKQ